ncbi:D-alanyl-D-alanine carboxypeptidase [Roseibium hamelinense]|uniref:D-alanyl-D-alanine carboxypeptidase n=1 Tax=Roseibium hamelinense TaxID=150831 RepID=A0A562SGD3_9HYPH|nr:D-alanyl-D-alanine carboxypeptidase [Roseibium hamelinense]MTI44192.1 D-alanyl-D-alanine carboxypeptidase [Roseibium hamelinense]TWI80024.1 D-alanyl-D-alanine carboxypeptidase [Roseibium hamelinense]
MRLTNVGRKVSWAVKAALVATALTAAAPEASANPKFAGIVVDAKTGKTLYASSADAYRYPASLTKIMTLYLVFEELEAGRLTLDSRFKVSKYAAGRPPSKIGLKPGSTIKVKDAVLALVTKSANDVATVVAENIGGSEAGFARRMTRTARQLGMSKTTFKNPHGLPNSGQRTTARDMATLGRAVQERFPQYYKYFNTRVYTYKGRRYGNHNKLLGRVKGVDGIKTGYIRASGFNLVTSVKRDNRHIVAVVMGGRTGASRNAFMTKLIGEHLRKASTGPRTAPLVAKASGIQPTFVAAKLNDIPLPNAKPGDEPAATGAPMVLAMTAPPARGSAGSITSLVTGSVPVPPKAVGSRVATAFEVATAPVPRSSPERDEDTSVTVATNNTEDQIPGWQVQIAAAETETAAIKMLKKASAATGSALRSKVPHTEPVETNGQTLYRARFVGFETKTAAWNACKTLKKAKFACFAIYQ